MGVADIGEMVDLGARLDRRGLGLHEFADPEALAGRGAGAQARIGADGSFLSDRGLHSAVFKKQSRSAGMQGYARPAKVRGFGSNGTKVRAVLFRIDGPEIRIRIAALQRRGIQFTQYLRFAR